MAAIDPSMTAASTNGRYTSHVYEGANPTSSPAASSASFALRSTPRTSASRALVSASLSPRLRCAPRRMPSRTPDPGVTDGKAAGSCFDPSSFAHFRFSDSDSELVASDLPAVWLMTCCSPTVACPLQVQAPRARIVLRRYGVARRFRPLPTPRRTLTVDTLPYLQDFDWFLEAFNPKASGETLSLSVGLPHGNPRQAIRSAIEPSLSGPRLARLGPGATGLSSGWRARVSAPRERA